MTTFTRNFRLTKPDFNSEGWDTQLNTNLDQIDTLIGQFNTGLAIQGIWLNATLYTAGQSVVDSLTGHIWLLTTTYTSSVAPTTFVQDRALYPTYWVDVTNPATSATVSATAAAASAAASAASATTAANSVTAAGVSATAAAGSAVAAAMSATVSTSSVGRNLFHNGEFLVQQRGTGAVTTNLAYSADRWMQLLSTSSLSTAIIALADADRTAIGDEAALFTLRWIVTGSAGAADFALGEQRLESVQRYGGKTLVVSFWAKVASGTASVGVGAAQFFGSGGSPSASVNVTATPILVTTTWTRYTATVVLPTTIGKTLGSTAGTDYTAIRFWLSSGATNNAIAGSIGVQTATVFVWGMQAEIATAVTPFEKRSHREHWSDCVRFFCATTAAVSSYYPTGASGATTVGPIYYPAVMRSLPVLTQGATIISTNISALVLTSHTNASGMITVTIGALVGIYTGVVNITASSDL